MFEPWVALESYSRQYHREILARVEVERLVRSAAPARLLAPRLRRRLLERLGRGLVTLGNRMQEADLKRAS